jgi:hypothetical protein
MGTFTPVPGAMVTVNGEVPFTPLTAALTVVAPEAEAVARPDELMAATAELAIDHVAVDVTFAVVPLL